MESQQPQQSLSGSRGLLQQFMEAIEAEYSRHNNTPSFLRWSQIETLVHKLKALHNIKIIHKSQQKDFIDYLLMYIEMALSFVTNQEDSGYRKQRHFAGVLLGFVSDFFKDSDIKNTFVEQATVKIFDMFMYGDFNTVTKRELLRLFNEIALETKKQVRIDTAKSIIYYMYKLLDCLSTYGDYVMQADIMETLYRIFGSEIRNNPIPYELLPGSPELGQALVTDISVTDFDADVRRWLNKFNRESQFIFSIECKTILFGNTVCKSPDESLWVDFNMKENVVSFYIEDNDSNLWNRILLIAKDVKKVEVKRLFGSTENSTTVSMHLSKPGISEMVQCQEYFNALEKHVKIIISNDEKENITKLITQILPRVFGDTFSHTSTRISDKIKQVYKPLGIKISKKKSTTSELSSGTSKSKSSILLSQLEPPKHSILKVLSSSASKISNTDDSSARGIKFSTSKPQTPEANDDISLGASDFTRYSSRHSDPASVITSRNSELFESGTSEENLHDARFLQHHERVKLQDNIVTSSHVAEEEVLASSVIDIISGSHSGTHVVSFEENFQPSDFQPSEVFSSSPVKKCTLIVDDEFHSADLDNIEQNKNDSTNNKTKDSVTAKVSAMMMSDDALEDEFETAVEDLDEVVINNANPEVSKVTGNKPYKVSRFIDVVDFKDTDQNTEATVVKCVENTIKLSKGINLDTEQKSKSNIAHSEVENVDEVYDKESEVTRETEKSCKVSYFIDLSVHEESVVNVNADKKLSKLNTEQVPTFSHKMKHHSKKIADKNTNDSKNSAETTDKSTEGLVEKVDEVYDKESVVTKETEKSCKVSHFIHLSAHKETVANVNADKKLSKLNTEQVPKISHTMEHLSKKIADKKTNDCKNNKTCVPRDQKILEILSDWPDEDQNAAIKSANDKDSAETTDKSTEVLVENVDAVYDKESVVTKETEKSCKVSHFIDLSAHKETVANFNADKKLSKLNTEQVPKMSQTMEHHSKKIADKKTNDSKNIKTLCVPRDKEILEIVSDWPDEDQNAAIKSANVKDSAETTDKSTDILTQDLIDAPTQNNATNFAEPSQQADSEEIFSRPTQEYHPTLTQKGKTTEDNFTELSLVVNVGVSDNQFSEGLGEPVTEPTKALKTRPDSSAKVVQIVVPSRQENKAICINLIGGQKTATEKDLNIKTVSVDNIQNEALLNTPDLLNILGGDASQSSVLADVIIVKDDEKEKNILEGYEDIVGELTKDIAKIKTIASNRIDNEDNTANLTVKKNNEEDIIDLTVNKESQEIFPAVNTSVPVKTDNPKITDKKIVYKAIMEVENKEADGSLIKKKARRLIKTGKKHFILDDVDTTQPDSVRSDIVRLETSTVPDQQKKLNQGMSSKDDSEITSQIMKAQIKQPRIILERLVLSKKMVSCGSDEEWAPEISATNASNIETFDRLNKYAEEKKLLDLTGIIQKKTAKLLISEVDVSLEIGDSPDIFDKLHSEQIETKENSNTSDAETVKVQPKTQPKENVTTSDAETVKVQPKENTRTNDAETVKIQLKKQPKKQPKIQPKENTKTSDAETVKVQPKKQPKASTKPKKPTDKKRNEAKIRVPLKEIGQSKTDKSVLVPTNKGYVAIQDSDSDDQPLQYYVTKTKKDPVQARKNHNMRPEETVPARDIDGNFPDKDLPKSGDTSLDLFPELTNTGQELVQSSKPNDFKENLDPLAESSNGCKEMTSRISQEKKGDSSPEIPPQLIVISAQVYCNAENTLHSVQDKNVPTRLSQRPMETTSSTESQDQEFKLPGNRIKPIKRKSPDQDLIEVACSPKKKKMQKEKDAPATNSPYISFDFLLDEADPTKSNLDTAGNGLDFNLDVMQGRTSPILKSNKSKDHRKSREDLDVLAANEGLVDKSKMDKTMANKSRKLFKPGSFSYLDELAVIEHTTPEFDVTPQPVQKAKKSPKPKTAKTPRTKKQQEKTKSAEKSKTVTGDSTKKAAPKKRKPRNKQGFTIDMTSFKTIDQWFEKSYKGLFDGPYNNCNYRGYNRYMNRPMDVVARTAPQSSSDDSPTLAITDRNLNTSPKLPITIDDPKTPQSSDYSSWPELEVEHINIVNKAYPTKKINILQDLVIKPKRPASDKETDELTKKAKLDKECLVDVPLPNILHEEDINFHEEDELPYIKPKRPASDKETDELTKKAKLDKECLVDVPLPNILHEEDINFHEEDELPEVEDKEKIYYETLELASRLHSYILSLTIPTNVNSDSIKKLRSLVENIPK